MNITTVPWQTHQQVISNIRHIIFVEEQGVSVQDEWDGLDELKSTIHLLASVNDKPVGTARLLATGQIGRMCVLKEFRQKRIGSELMSELLKLVKMNNNTIFLNAQVQVIPFYEHFGFKAKGNIFDDAGIPHQKMILTKL